MKKTRAKKKTKKRRASTKASPSASLYSGPDLTVVLVHGIGPRPHKPGARLTKWAQPVVKALGALSPDSAPQCGSVFDLSVPSSSVQGSAASPAPARNVPAMDVALTGAGQTRTVRFVEGNWHAPFTKRQAVAALWEVVTLLPLAALLVAFDRRDRQALENFPSKVSDSPPAGGGRWSKHLKKARLDPLGELDEVAPFFRVIARVLVGFALASWGISWVLSLGWASVLVGATATAIFLLVLLPLVGQVLAAAAGGEEIDHVSEPIRDVIQYAGAESRRTLVVGHSQGGFLAHRVLTSTRKSSRADALIGIGSGVKPIHLIHQIQAQRLRGPMWLAAAGALCGPFAVLVTVDWKVPLVVREWWRAVMTLPMLFFTEASPQETNAHLKPLTGLSWAKINPLDGIVLHPSWWTVLFLVTWVGAVVLLRRVASKLQAVRPISALPGVDWTEVTSHSDFVGRLLYPSMPNPVREVDVTLGANPLLDHLTYFKTFSEVPRIIAAKIMTLTCDDKTLEAIIDKETAALIAAGKRRRHVRATAVWAPLLFLTIVSMVDYGATLGSCLLALAPHSVGLIIVCALTLWSAEVTAQWGLVNEPVEGGPALRRAFHAQRAYEYVHRQRRRIIFAGLLAHTLLIGAVPSYYWIMPGHGIALACFWMALLLILYTAARACGYMPKPYLMLTLFLLILHSMYTSAGLLSRALTQYFGKPIHFLDLRGSMPLVSAILSIGFVLVADLPVTRRLFRRPLPPKKQRARERWPAK